MLLVRGLSAASSALLPVENPSNHLRSFAYLSIKKGFSSGKSKSPRLNLHQFLHRHKTSFLPCCQVHIHLNPVNGLRVYSEAAFHIQTDLLVEDNVTVSLHPLEKKRTRRNRKAVTNIIEKEVDDTGQCVIEEENRLVPQRSKSSAQNSPGKGKTGKKAVKSGTKSLSNSCICVPEESENVIAPLSDLGINEAVDSPGKGKTSKKAVKSDTKSLSDVPVIELGINESVIVKKFTRKKIIKSTPSCESDLGHCEAVSGAGDSLGIKESTPLATPKKIRVSKITKEVKDLKLAEGKSIVTSKKAKATRQRSNMQCSDVMQLLKTDAGLASESELAPNVPQVNGKDSEETPASILFDVARCKEANVDLFQSLNSPTGGATTTIKSLQLDERSRKKAAEEFDGAANILPKKKKKHTPGSQLRWSLDQCSKNGDVLQALAIYDKTLSEGLLQLNQYHYNVILYLCASAALGSLLPAKSGKDRSGPTDGDCLGGSMAGLVGNNELGLSKDVMEMIQKRGFEVYEHMKVQGVSPNEATFTAVARLAVAKRDGGLAFQMVKETGSAGITTRLRSYGPALYVFYLNKEHEKAFEVDAHMVAHGVQPEESELEVLLHLSIDAGLNDKVYSLLHRLRATVRAISPSTVALIEKWFSSEAAKNTTGDDTLTIEGIRSAITSRGGGWHGLGWLGLGHWRACYTTLNKIGVCLNCGERLVTIDIDPQETEKFAESLATLASSREPTNNFKRFQEWVDRHGPYEAVVDGANVAMYNQNFAQAGFTFTQLNAVVTGLQHRSPSKNLPLIILHNRRVVGGPALSSHAQQLLQQWTREEALYTTPTGSNDDWYWLYAAVKYKCLLVTNDEMRDHLFQLLGNDFFPKWKERHQVRFNITHRGAAVFHMPPPYSIVIQESERGSWHIPKSGGDDITSPREWLCVTRPAT